MIGYVPENPVFRLESRHLGLVTPQEIGEIREQLAGGRKDPVRDCGTGLSAEDRRTVFRENAGSLVQ